MRNLKIALALTLAPLVSSACSGNADDTEDTSAGDNYDRQTLEEFRAAIPPTERVQVVVPGPEAQANALTELGDAELARLAIQSAVKINLPAKLMVGLLKTIVSLPPTAYNSEEKKFVWGPWDNDDGVGKVLVFIQENEPDADFRYSYAFLRLPSRDLAKAEPVIWGGATPDVDNDDYGVGVTLWDFEANNAFDAEYDPNYDTDEGREQGRFAQVYGRGSEDNGEFTFNVAVFRDFLPDDAGPEDSPANLDYFFGRFNPEDGGRLHFVDWVLEGDLCDAAADSCFENNTRDDVVETLGLRAAFVNRGVGRAEATVFGGDLDDSLDVVECWDADIDRTYVGVSQNGDMVGEEGACEAPFDQGLEALGVPSLADVDAELLAKMDCVAEKGPSACDD